MDVQLKTIGLLIFMVIQERVSGADVPVRKGESVVLPCGVETSVGNGYFKWEVILKGETGELADNLSGEPVCNVQLMSCDVYSNGSIELHNVDEVDGARTYRCFRGGDGVFDYFSDHHLMVLPDDTTPEDETPSSFDRETVHSARCLQGDDGVVHAYRQPVCRNRRGMNLNVSCTPASGELVQEMSQTIDCTCYESSGGVMDTLLFDVIKFDSPSTSCAAWILVVVLLILLALLILIYVGARRRYCCSIANNLERKLRKGKKSVPCSDSSQNDTTNVKQQEEDTLLKRVHPNNGPTKRTEQYGHKTQQRTDADATHPDEQIGNDFAVQTTDTVTVIDETAEGAWHDKYEFLQAKYDQDINTKSQEIKEKEDEIRVWHDKYEFLQEDINTKSQEIKEKEEEIQTWRDKCQSLQKKFARYKDTHGTVSESTTSSVSSVDQPDVATGYTVSLQRNKNAIKAYDIGEHRGDKQFHLTFSLESPGLKIALSSCRVGEASKFELEFKEGKIGAIKFGEEQEYIQCSNGTVKFDLILDGCQLSLHEKLPGGAHPLMEHEHRKFNLCSFLDMVKLNNSCDFEILRDDKLTARHL